MGKNILKTFFILLFFVGVLVFLQMKQLLANANKFDGVVPFSTTSGAIGFFNQNDGKVYLYDTSLQNCVLTVQIEELGKSGKTVVQPAKRY